MPALNSRKEGSVHGPWPQLLSFHFLCITVPATQLAFKKHFWFIEPLLVRGPAASTTTTWSTESFKSKSTLHPSGWMSHTLAISTYLLLIRVTEWSRGRASRGHFLWPPSCARRPHLCSSGQSGPGPPGRPHAQPPAPSLMGIFAC